MQSTDHFANEIARKLAADQDTLIRRCISARIGDSWTDEEIFPRMRIEFEPERPERTFLLDGKPLVTIWPAESVMESDGNSTHMNWSVRCLEHP